MIYVSKTIGFNPRLCYVNYFAPVTYKPYVHYFDLFAIKKHELCKQNDRFLQKLLFYLCNSSFLKSRALAPSSSMNYFNKTTTFVKTYGFS